MSIGFQLTQLYNETNGKTKIKTKIVIVTLRCNIVYIIYVSVLPQILL